MYLGKALINSELIIEEGLVENQGSKFYSKAYEKSFSWLEEFRRTVGVGHIEIEGVRGGDRARGLL